MYKKIKGGRIVQPVNPKAAVPSAHPTLVRTYKVTAWKRAIQKPQGLQTAKVSFLFAPHAWGLVGTLLHVVLTQDPSQHHPASCWWLSHFVGQSQSGGRPSFRGAGSEFPPRILREENLDIVEHCPRASGMGTECRRETEERPWPISSIRGCQRPEGTCSLLSPPALLTLQVHHEPRCPGGAGAYILPGPASDTALLPTLPSWAQRQTQGTLEEKYGVSKLKCSLAIKSNPCIHREKLRLRESDWIPRTQLVMGRAGSPETLSSVCPFCPSALKLQADVLVVGHERPE